MAGQHVDFGYSLALCVEVRGDMMAQQQKTYTYLYSFERGWAAAADRRRTGTVLK